MEIRTVIEFVEELAAEGRSLKEILTVARNSRWSNQQEEIKQEYSKLKKRSVGNIR